MKDWTRSALARAVIGGLLFATVSTLFFVPVIFAGIHRRLEQRANALFPDEPPAEGNV
jgi:Cu/Ag efflux pump CusA